MAIGTQVLVAIFFVFPQSVATGESIPETKKPSTGTTQFFNIKKIQMRKKYLFYSQKDRQFE